MASAKRGFKPNWPSCCCRPAPARTAAPPAWPQHPQAAGRLGLSAVAGPGLLRRCVLSREHAACAPVPRAGRCDWLPDTRAEGRAAGHPLAWPRSSVARVGRWASACAGPAVSAPEGAGRRLRTSTPPAADGFPLRRWQHGRPRGQQGRPLRVEVPGSGRSAMPCTDPAAMAAAQASATATATGGGGRKVEGGGGGGPGAAAMGGRGRRED